MPWIDTGRVSLYYEFYWKDARSGDVPVLLLHELGGSSEGWRAIVPLLAVERRVIAVDLRCAGRSEKPPGPFTLAEAADDLVALLQVLSPKGPVDVIGAALGSVVGALLAIRHPARVRRLIAIAPYMTDATRAYVAERAEKVRVVGMRGVAEASLANSFPERQPADAAYHGNYLANDPAAYAELSLALARLEMTPADWSAIRAPVLFVTGGNNFRQVSALIPGAQIASIDDAGQFPHLFLPAMLAGYALNFFAA